MALISNEAVAEMTRIENEAKRCEKLGYYRWDNKLLSYREANEAFMANDVDALKAVWIKWFC